MDKVMRGLPFVSTYIDDVLIHSTDDEMHAKHLNEVFMRLRKAGLTLRGKKCVIGTPQVTYLGHLFTGSGVTPDREKVKAVEEWPIPHNATEVRQFLGLASYYRRFIQNFADVAAPFTQKDVVFSWSNDCSRAFKTLKCKLIGAPILVYPRVDKEASQFQLQTDASVLGLGAVLEQGGGGHVIAYASQILTKAEANYSVIQARVFGCSLRNKAVQTLSLGRSFQLWTDHKPLQWLSEQRMEGMLCRWALALQEYIFTVEYRKGSHNDNADALSRRRETVGRASHLAATRSTTGVLAEQIRIAQQKDDIIQQVYQALREGVVYRTYIPGPTSEAITVPVLLACLCKEYLTLCHDSATGGHQGWHKTLHKLRREAYWVNMAQDADQHCRECNICQRTKPTAPKRAPLINIPVGRPWQMVAVDILEVLVSSNNNRYILVVQGFFTKWADARPIPDQTAVRITRELVHIFAGYGIPEIIHSDQGRNFESTIFQQTMAAFGVKKSRTTAYHPQGDGMVERFNRTLLQLLRAYVDQQNEWETYLPLALYAYRTSTHTSTSVSPFELMFGRQPKDHTEGQTGYAVDEYQGTMQAKLAELMDFVETHMVDAARHQKQEYDKHMGIRTFKAGDLVWLSIPMAGKLDPRWEGGWKVKACKSPVNMEVNDGTRNRVVHVNRLRHRIQMAEGEEVGSTDRTQGEWVPPQIEHITVEGTPPQGPEPDLENNDQPVQPEEPIQRRYLSRSRRPPDYIFKLEDKLREGSDECNLGDLMNGEEELY
eukprot:Em0239g5a